MHVKCVTCTSMYSQLNTYYKEAEQAYVSEVIDGLRQADAYRHL